MSSYWTCRFSDNVDKDVTSHALHSVYGSQVQIDNRDKLKESDFRAYSFFGEPPNEKILIDRIGEIESKPLISPSQNKE